MSRVRVGVVGCGDVSLYVYLPALHRASDLAEVTAVCDLDPARADLAARQFGVPHTFNDVARFLGEAPIDAVFTLTPNQHHYGVTLAALRAAKHVYTEKTLALTLEDADRLLAEADAAGLCLASAPAVVLDPVNQVAKRLLAEGAIGRHCFCSAHYGHGGPARSGYFGFFEAELRKAGISSESVASTDPTWFYKQGAGPLFDLGVYALHALTGVLGPVRRVTAVSGRALPQLTIEGGLARGKTIDVEVDDSSLLLLDFGDNSFASLDASYNVRASRSPRFEYFGADGTIAIHAGGKVELFRTTGAAAGGWQAVDVDGPAWSLGAGVPEFLRAVAERRKATISGEHARHVLEVMLKAYEAARSGQTQEIVRTF